MQQISCWQKVPVSPGARTVSCVLHHPRARGWVPATPRTGTKLRSSEQPPRLRRPAWRPTTLCKASARWGKARAELGAAAMRLLSRYHCDGEDAHQKPCDSSASPFLCKEERELGSEFLPTGCSPLGLVCTCPWLTGMSALPFRESSPIALLRVNQRCYAAFTDASCFIRPLVVLRHLHRSFSRFLSCGRGNEVNSVLQ